jgi:lysophospholipid acyltransferase (LPLAT)-like uncharacterized protein
MRLCALSSKKCYKIVKKIVAFLLQLCYITSKQKDKTRQQNKKSFCITKKLNKGLDNDLYRRRHNAGNKK